MPWSEVGPPIGEYILTVLIRCPLQLSGSLSRVQVALLRPTGTTYQYPDDVRGLICQGVAVTIVTFVFGRLLKPTRQPHKKSCISCRQLMHDFFVQPACGRETIARQKGSSEGCLQLRHDVVSNPFVSFGPLLSCDSPCTVR